MEVIRSNWSPNDQVTNSEPVLILALSDAWFGRAGHHISKGRAADQLQKLPEVVTRQNWSGDGRQSPPDGLTSSGTDSPY